MRPVRCLLPLLLSLAACDPFHTEFEPSEEAVLYEGAVLDPAPEPGATLRVTTYNIKYGGARLKFFWECGGTRGNMSKAEVMKHLEAVAAAIRVIDPDVLLLQEADVASKRSAYVDQVQVLLDSTALNYGAYASQWKADYIPSDGLGAMDSGNAVLSRWPISDAVRIALPLISNNDALTNYFYLKRNIMKLRTRDLWVLDTHLEAFDTDGTRKKQLDRLLAEMNETSELLIAGGDLNTAPPATTLVKQFPDECDDSRFAPDDYSDELHFLQPFYDAYRPVITLSDYAADNAPYLTFTGDERVPWNRTLDYLFTNGDWASGVVHQSAAQGGVDTLLLSDHAPVTGELVLP